MKKAVSLRLSGDIFKKIKARAKVHGRNFSNQVEEYLNIAMAVEDNPDLPYSFIKETLIAREEIDAGLGEPYQWGLIK